MLAVLIGKGEPLVNLSASFPIETHYNSAGSWAISTEKYTDASGQIYDLFYPTDLGSDGLKHPILTWGDGSFGTPEQLYGGAQPACFMGLCHYRLGQW